MYNFPEQYLARSCESMDKMILQNSVMLAKLQELITAVNLLSAAVVKVNPNKP